MKVTAQAKLVVTQAQADSLKHIMETANAAANFASRLAWDNRAFGRVLLQKLVNHSMRQEFGVSAQSACLIVRKVADAYTLDKKTIRKFRPLGAVAYDDRTLAWKMDGQVVSIWTMDGRLTIPFVAGDYQTKLLSGQRGETDLVYRGGEFYLFSTCDVEEQPDVSIGIIVVEHKDWLTRFGFKQLRRWQRRLSRHVKGVKNRSKARMKVARLHM